MKIETIKNDDDLFQVIKRIIYDYTSVNDQIFEERYNSSLDCLMQLIILSFIAKLFIHGKTDKRSCKRYLLKFLKKGADHFFDDIFADIARADKEKNDSLNKNCPRTID